MKILILGGTVFVGRHLARVAHERGHEVTVFNRGRSAPGTVPPGVSTLLGDRDGDLAALEGGRWDAVLDVCGYLPRVVRDSARLLAERAGHVTFVSTISVYQDPAPGSDESAPVRTLEDPSTEIKDGKTYGPLKFLCERAVEEEWSGRCLIVRPGLIVGPDDSTGRFTYWPRRVAQGGPVLAPDVPDQPVQLIDVRDLASWIVDAVEAGRTGTFNTVGPETSITFGDLLDRCVDVVGSGATIVRVPEEFLISNEVQPFMHIPLWIPAGFSPGFFAVDASKARRAGLVTRPLEETIRDTLAWDRSLGEAAPRGPVMSRETESRLLAAWGATRRAPSSRS